MHQDPHKPESPSPAGAPSPDASTAPTAHQAAPTSFAAPGSGIFQPTDIDGRYRLLRVIGRGGMGTVYLAQQQQPSRFVAIKLLPGPLEHADALARFRREAQLVAQLSHPGIAHVYEAGSCDQPGGSIPFYAMEYIEAGKPLTEAADARNLNLRARVELFCQICDAAHHAHERGVLHRDLKPANILVGTDGRPRIIDFGIARAPAGMAPITVGDASFGTPAYMSPEQLRASAAVDRRADVYSLGVVLYELLCGQRPYAMPAGLLEGRVAIGVVRVKPPRSANADLPEELVPVLIKSLAKDADDRYASAAALADDLRRWLAGALPAARSPSGFSRSRSALRAIATRRPLRTGVLITAAAVTLAETAGVAVLHEYTSASDRWGALMCSWFPPSSPPGMSHVVVVAASDPAMMPTLASELGLAGVDADLPVTWRPLHGALMQRLAQAEPRVVAWDVVFAGASEDPSHDEALAQGARSLLAANAEVVTSFYSWSQGGRGDLQSLSPRLMEALDADNTEAARWGGISGVFNAQSPWALTFAVRQSDGAVLPSLSLRAYAAWLGPRSQPTFGFNDDGFLTINFRRRDPTVPGAQRASTSEARVPIADLGTTNEPEFGLTPSLEFARLPLALPDDATLAASTISYADAMRSDPAALRARINGRAVLVANTSIETDIWPHAGGRQVSGVYAHAAALDALIDGRTLHQSSAIMLLMEVISAAIGTALGLGSHHRRLLAAAATLGVGLAMTAVCAWAWFAGSIVLSPLVPAAGLLVAFAAASWIAPRRAAPHQRITAE